MSGDKGRQPDFTVWAANQGETAKGKVGAAWVNDDQSINIKLNPFVVLEQVEDITLKLFPNDGKFEERQAAKAKPAKRPDDLEDDIPF